ncbi:hypothetical protein BN1708_006696 [Verticillium longisporum]|uniref:3-beta hydroxysteroid dehydrogenase/isomerase domain-containing protein n=1 Tax=Verticillium longisporum TaxID=100787 RepID=A0A0G4MMH8_VERLO|nr:hypothetical protein BN1708_006696 [Verticillium longisporum]
MASESWIRSTTPARHHCPPGTCTVLPPFFLARKPSLSLVGGQIVLQLLQRGPAPSSIRIIDFVPPTQDELQTPLAKDVEFAQTDISSEASTLAASKKPWQATSAKLPLTVFHTTAAIRPSERHPLVYHRHARVNVGGTANVLSAAKSAGADIFIFTSSCSVALRPVTWFSPLWRRWPTNIVQTMTEDDFSAPLRPREDFPSNYARSKAEAERHVCAADSPVSGLRTGAIRPGNSIYGGAGDFLVSATLNLPSLPTCTAPWVQNWAHASNVSLAHLLLEAALLGPHVDKARIAGRPFLVTDAGPPLRFDDFYTAMKAVAATFPTVRYPPPVLMMAIARVIELWCVTLWKSPFLARLGMREPENFLYLLQPACFTAAVNCHIDDSAAKRPVEEGGIGYQARCTTLEGICMQLLHLNRSVPNKRVNGKEATRSKTITWALWIENRDHRQFYAITSN